MNNLAIADNGGDDFTELRRVAFELAITLEALSAGLEAVARSPAAASVRDELSVLVKFSQEAGADIDSLINLLHKK